MAWYYSSITYLTVTSYISNFSLAPGFGVIDTIRFWSYRFDLVLELSNIRPEFEKRLKFEKKPYFGTGLGFRLGFKGLGFQSWLGWRYLP